MERDAFTNEIRNWLQNSGAVKSLQTKLRKDLIDAISNKPEFVNGKKVGVLKLPLQEALSKFDGTLNLFVIEHLMRRGLWYTASIMATEAEFLKDLKPPDIEEVKVMSSIDNDKNISTPLIRHHAEKLDEMTIRSAIDNLYLRNSCQGTTNGNESLRNNAKRNSFNEFINEKQLDELFRDYYRQRDNSVLQLLFLLFSKKELDRNENEEQLENVINEKYDPVDKNSKYTPKTSIRRTNRERVLQKEQSNESHDNMMGNSQLDKMNEDENFQEQSRQTYQKQTFLAEIGVQTSKEYKQLNLNRNNSLEDQQRSQTEGRKRLDEEKSEITKLKKQLEEAKAKIKDLEDEQLEVEERRAIEISSKYVPTSFRRISEYSSPDGNFFVNSPRLPDSIVLNKGHSDIASPKNGSLDYFISGVRKKVEDLCGCNEELIRPLNELSEMGTRTNRNSADRGMEPSHQKSRHPEQAENRFNQELGQNSKDNLKQKQSLSI